MLLTEIRNNVSNNIHDNIKYIYKFNNYMKAV